MDWLVKPGGLVAICAAALSLGGCVSNGGVRVAGLGSAAGEKLAPESGDNSEVIAEPDVLADATPNAPSQPAVIAVAGNAMLDVNVSPLPAAQIQMAGAQGTAQSLLAEAPTGALASGLDLVRSDTDALARGSGLNEVVKTVVSAGAAPVAQLAPPVLQPVAQTVSTPVAVPNVPAVVAPVLATGNTVLGGVAATLPLPGVGQSLIATLARSARGH